MFVHTINAHVDFVDAVLILMKSWSQLCQLQDELVAAIQHCEKEKRVKTITVFTRTVITDQKKSIFYDKAKRKLEFLVRNISVTGTALYLRYFFWRTSFGETVFPAFYNGLLKHMQIWNGTEDF